MAFPNSNWSDILSTTLYNRREKLADNFTNHVPLLRYLKQRGNVDPAPGGVSLVEEISYSGNSNFQRYSGYETLSVAASQVISAAEYAWKQAAIPVTASGLELRQNAGPDMIMKLLEKRTENAMGEFANNMAVDIFSDGSADGGKQVGGLQLLVADTPTSGTVGGINRASYSFWQNFSRDASSSSLGSVSASNVQAHFNQMRLNLVRNADRPDLIVCDGLYYDFYMQSLQAIQRITSESSAAAGFGNLMQYGPGGAAEVMFDPNSPASHAYFLNTKYIFFRPHRDANMTASPKKEAIDQDACVVHILWQGNMTMSNASLQGVLKD
jgi:hypothetical protein